MKSAEDKMSRAAMAFAAFVVLAILGVGYALYKFVWMFWQIGSAVL